MKKKYLIFIFSLLLIGGIGYVIYNYYYGDIRSNKFFTKFLNIENAKVKTICLDYDLSLFSEGTSVEVYKLSDETFNSFISNYKSIDKSYFTEYFNFDSIVLWSLTPPNYNILDLIDLKYPLEKHTKCFNLKTLNDILEIPDNYYSMAYIGDIYFYFFLIDSKTRNLYIVQSTW